MASKPKTERRPTTGKPSRFLPGAKVLLHATVEHTREDNGRDMISVIVHGSAVWNIVYLPADEAEPDPGAD